LAALRIPSPEAYVASAHDPDTLTWDQAMADQEHVEEWRQAIDVEVRALEQMETWEEVPKSEAQTKILPGTWVLRVKRNPDGRIKKYKARYCVRGDLQEGEFDTFAPVVAWTTIRLLLILALTLEWYTCSVDFSSAFVQAVLDDPVWIHLPRGFRSINGLNTCLRLKKSLYGLSMAPKLWYEHLKKAILSLGLHQSNEDPCLFIGDNLFFAQYVDDVILVAPTEDIIDQLIASLRSLGFELTKEDSLCEYLGIKFERNDEQGTFTLTQTGLIDKILEATGLTNCNPNHVPCAMQALGSDPEGEPMQETWSYPSIVGMLLYLCTNTRPDISFAVSQVARFSSNAKQSHAKAIKTLVRYLSSTKQFGMIIKPTKEMALDLYVDADFAGLHRREPDHIPDSVRSRSGYIVQLAGCPLVWKSQLQTELSMSTLEAEYSALSYSLRTLLPLKRLLIEVVSALPITASLIPTIKARAFEDNQGAYYLATNKRITNRTKYFLVKYHWFWSHHERNEFVVYKIDTQEQLADYFTKGLSRESFERNRLAVQGW
jgi:hypothetical protein